MKPLNLDEVRARRERAAEWMVHGDDASVSHGERAAWVLAVRDIPALLAEIVALRAQVADAELFGIGKVMNALDSDAIAAVLRNHSRMDVGHCRCGWGVDSGDLGKPHSEHVLAAIASTVREVLDEYLITY